MSDNSDLHKEQQEYSYKLEQKEFYNKFKDSLMTLLQPMVKNLVNYIRSLEMREKGLGKGEIDKMLLSGDINQPMYEILKESIENLDKDYEVELKPENYFTNTKLN